MCLACTWSIHFAENSPGQIAASRRGFLRTSALVCAAVAAPRVFGTISAAAETADGPADFIFENGPVYTVDPEQEWARAVAVRGTRIVYVGDAVGAGDFKGPATRIVDLAGRLLLPGFIEGHIHPLLGAPLTRGVDLQYDTREATLDALRRYAETAPDRGAIHGVVRGFGWRYSAFPPSGPTRQDLDAIWPDVPVFFGAVDGHSAWVNSRSLELAGVTKDTPEPLPGFSYFAKDPGTGEPTGYVIESQAVLKVIAAAAPLTRDFIVESLEAWVDKASAAGITAVFDAGMAVVTPEDGFAIYGDLEQRGKLPFRVTGSYYLNKSGFDPFPELEALIAGHQSELVRAKVLKIMMDGVDSNGSAAMLAPYADNPRSSGQTIFTADQMNSIVQRADAKGIDVHVHAIGDRAARLSLDAIEAAIAANPPRDRRHTIAHNQLTDPADIPRFAKLGVIAEFSGQWHCTDDSYWSGVTLPRWGLERSNREYRIGEILRHGATVSLGTDWPAGGNSSIYRPLQAMQIAITRQELGKPDAPPLPPADDRLTLAEAVRASTMGSAYQIGLDDSIGSIAVGKLADLVVLDRNIFERPVEEMQAAAVELTLMNGKVRHDALT